MPFSPAYDEGLVPSIFPFDPSVGYKGSPLILAGSNGSAVIFSCFSFSTFAAVSAAVLAAALGVVTSLVLVLLDTLDLVGEALAPPAVVVDLLGDDLRWTELLVVLLVVPPNERRVVVLVPVVNVDVVLGAGRAVKVFVVGAEVFVRFAVVELIVEGDFLVPFVVDVAAALVGLLVTVPDGVKPPLVLVN